MSIARPVVNVFGSGTCSAVINTWVESVATRTAVLSVGESVLGFVELLKMNPLRLLFTATLLAGLREKKSKSLLNGGIGAKKSHPGGAAIVLVPVSPNALFPEGISRPA